VQNVSFDKYQGIEVKIASLRRQHLLFACVLIEDYRKGRIIYPSQHQQKTNQMPHIETLKEKIF
jgi:hypothetical protein